MKEKAESRQYRCGVMCRTKFAWLPMATIAVAIAMWTGGSSAEAHEFEDGHVERAVSVVVRNRTARIEYSLGLNPTTRQRLIEFWQSQAKTANADRVDEGRVDEVREDEGNEVVEDKGKADSTDGAESNMAFLALAGANISRRLRIDVNELSIDPKLVSALPSSRHHVDVTVTLEFTIPQINSDDSIELTILDQNFLSPQPVPQQQTDADPLDPSQTDADPLDLPQAKPSEIGLLTAAERADDRAGDRAVSSESFSDAAPFSGGFRYALKATGSTVLIRSNVAPILIRAQRTLDSQTTDFEKCFTIDAVMTRVK